MKQALLLLAAVVFTFTANAAILTVCNSTYEPAQFSSLQAAHDAAASGDTLLVSATSMSYNDLFVSKEIHVFGGKSFPGQGPMINIVRLDGTAASGSTFHSLHIVNFNSTASTEDNIDNIQVIRCHIGTMGLASPANFNLYKFWLIEGNVFYFNIPSYSIYVNGNYALLSFSTLRNNVFNSLLTTLDNCLLDHNVFTSIDNSNTSLSDVYYTTISNNIFYGVSANGGIYNHDNIYLNNLTYGGTTTTLPIGISNNIGSGNIENTSPGFVNVPINAPYSPDFDYTLTNGSIAIGAGTDDFNLGAVDGTGKYREDTEPGIPVVRSITIPGGNTVPANGTFQIQVNSVSHD